MLKVNYLKSINKVQDAPYFFIETFSKCKIIICKYSLICDKNKDGFRIKSMCLYFIGNSF